MDSRDATSATLTGSELNVACRSGGVPIFEVKADCYHGPGHYEIPGGTLIFVNLDSRPIGLTLFGITNRPFTLE